MDIAGRDLQIQTEMAPETQVRFMLSYLRVLWPDLTTESVDNELLVYQNAEAAASWDRHGRLDSNATSMVHLIPEPGLLTIVHEGLDEAEITKNFLANRFLT